MSGPIRIILVDDHDLVRESWKQLLNNDPKFKVIAVLKNGTEAIEQSINLLPDIILMDINMTPVNGFEATEKILSSVPSAKIIGISVNNNPRYSAKMLSLGAKGFVTKTSTLNELKKAILRVHGGETYVCEEIRKKDRQ
ncbi:MAG: response regulator transcription factor [Bacteroidota bacterium]|nr:response regulator transcription factor [Bacteroidota bacterium]